MLQRISLCPFLREGEKQVKALTNRETVIGSKIRRVDAVPKVDGKAKFVADIYFDRMIYCYLVLAKKSHGILKAIYTDQALKVPGVIGVYTHMDVPGENQLGEVVKDMPCLVPIGEKIRYYGDVVAVVAAETYEIAKEAAEKVRLEIVDLPPVLTIEESIKDKVKVHEPTNISIHKKIRKGNVENGFKRCDEIFEGEFYAHYQEQAYLEPQGVIVTPDIDYGFTVYGTMQCPYYVQNSVARVLAIPLNRVRVIQTETGGGFGGKEDVPSFVASYAAVAAYNTGRPAKLIYDREVDIQTTSKRHPIKSHYKIGVRKDGKLEAMEIAAYMDMGAYATLSPIVMFRTLVHAAGSYEIPDVKVDVYGVYTNKVPPGAFRGFGSPQVLFAVESMMDEISKKLGIDPIELRLKNTLREGSKTATDHLLLESVGAVKTLENLREISRWEQLKKEVETFNNTNENRKRGIGVSHIFYGVSLGAAGQHLDASGSHVQINADGTVDVRIGGTEMGQGAKTVIAMIAAEELGQDVQKINVHQPDTAFVPDSGPTVASRTTVYSGNATRLAASELRKRLINVFCELTGSSTENVDWGNGKFYDTVSNKEMSFDELVEEAFRKNVKLNETGWYETPRLEWDAERGIGEAYVTYSFASQIVVVEVNLNTGQAKVIKAYTSHDVGKALNPEGIIGQVQGGFIQGMGYALYEDLKLKNGQIITDNFNTYIIPTIHEIPEELVIDIVEDPFSRGPYGAKGIGEPSLMPTPAAIANAISRAIGKRVTRIPATPEYILKLIKED
ncbi:xanthine dehydrogenase [Kosmotoga arenicorallina S304]|uniref:Xanthine dehydrogenase n=1 Tax=Kosmotoga arenicorallina S304 TaxID=1453497 RepID=A0A176JXK4_9BACT|nr:xanthine dehydrogenase family protein molybdopterin-binding subunit [Kosmotoga arenicorallina]OAA28452.1 xanthine dehydrogenase [Kosmotoga arenicorallina S304]